MLRIFEKFEKTEHMAYTLAEMLIVLLIITMVLLALPRVTKKLYNLTPKAGNNGRMECFYDEGGTLTKYYGTSTGQSVTCKLGNSSCEEHFTTVPDPNDPSISYNACVFEPPGNPVYLALHAVGAGGAGAWVKHKINGNYYDYVPPTYPDETSGGFYKTNTQSLGIGYTGEYPDWYKRLLNVYKDSTKINNFTVTSQVKSMLDDLNTSSENRTGVNLAYVSYVHKLNYAYSGAAGKIVSMFFPSIPGNTKLIVVPGVHGIAHNTGDGDDGGDTFVYMQKDTGERRLLATAKGGQGGKVFSKDKAGNTVLVENTTLSDPWGEGPSAYGNDKKEVVQKKDPGFIELIADGVTHEDSPLYAQKDNKAFLAPGSGGWGSFNVLGYNISRKLFYINDYEKMGDLNYFGSRWTNITPIVPYPEDRVPANKDSMLKFENREDSSVPRDVLIERSGFCKLNIKDEYGKRRSYCMIGNHMPDDIENAALERCNPIDIREGFQYEDGTDPTKLKQSTACAGFTIYPSNYSNNYLSLESAITTDANLKQYVHDNFKPTDYAVFENKNSVAYVENEPCKVFNEKQYNKCKSMYPKKYVDKYCNVEDYYDDTTCELYRYYNRDVKSENLNNKTWLDALLNWADWYYDPSFINNRSIISNWNAKYTPLQPNKDRVYYPIDIWSKGNVPDYVDGSGCYFHTYDNGTSMNLICNIRPEANASNKFHYIEVKDSVHKTFECPQTGAKTSHTCEPTNGGYGAVVLLW